LKPVYPVFGNMFIGKLQTIVKKGEKF